MSGGGFDVGGTMYSGITSFDWYGVESGGAMSCCYDYMDDEQNNKPIGFKTTFTEEEGDFETFEKVMHLTDDDGCSATILPFNSDIVTGDEDIEILWEYEYLISYQVFSQTELGANTFPSGYIEHLLSDELLIVVGEVEFTDVTCKHSGWKYKHVTIMFSWLGSTWEILGCQEGEWDDTAWVDGEYADISVFGVRKII